MVLTLLLVGLALLWFSKRQRLGKIVISSGVALALILSFPLTVGWISRPLQRFQPLDDLTPATGSRWVVVLGGGYSSPERVPPNGRLSAASLERLVEGIRLYRALPGAKLVMSGGSESRAAPIAQVLADAAVALGVPRTDVVLESTALDTAREAEEVQRIVGADRFVLVTSAVHLRRAMSLFEKRGMHPVPAPCGFWPNAGLALPASGQLVRADYANHEYMGLLWASLKGQI